MNVYLNDQLVEDTAAFGDVVVEKNDEVVMIGIKKKKDPKLKSDILDLILTMLSSIVLIITMSLIVAGRVLWPAVATLMGFYTGTIIEKVHQSKQKKNPTESV